MVKLEGVVWNDQHKRYIWRENVKDLFLLIANEFNHNLTSQTHLSPYHNDLEALFGNQIDITKFM